jgi:hypothetical protein
MLGALPYIRRMFRNDGLFLGRALQTLDITNMFKHTFRSQGSNARADSLLGRGAIERILQDGSGSPSRPALSIQLDEFLYACWLPGRWTQRVWIPSDLPPCLEQRARSLPPDALWRAYTDGARLWFAVATAAVSASYGPSAVAIEVLFFENDGTLCSGGIWTCHANGDWRLERLVGMSSETRFSWFVERAAGEPGPAAQLEASG